MRNFSILSNYNTWVNIQIFNLCESLSAHEYRLNRQAFFGSIHNTLNHILLVDILWLGHIKGQKQERIQTLDQILHDCFEDLRAERVSQDKEIVDFVDDLDDSDLTRVFKWYRRDGRQQENTVEEALFTLFNHQTHHRGQIHTMLTQAGIANSDLPGMDVVDYLAAVNQ